MAYEREQRGTVEPDPGMKRMAVGDTPVMVSIMVLGALGLLIAIRSGFRGVVIKV